METQAPLFILDTNILLHYIRDDRLAAWVRATYPFADLAGRQIISVVSEGEIRSLALQFGWGKARIRNMDELLDLALVVPLDFRGVLDAYARIDAHCRLAGTPIGENDTWIAATAHATGARLLTTDLDFARLDPLFLAHDWIDPQAYR